MARSSGSLDDLLRDALAPVLRRFGAQVARRAAALAAERMDGDLRAARRVRAAKPARPARPVRRPAARVELTRWVADRRARRVPNFVIALTGGLDTKKKIVARYGADVVFEKGKPAPKPRG